MIKERNTKILILIIFGSLLSFITLISFIGNVATYTSSDGRELIVPSEIFSDRVGPFIGPSFLINFINISIFSKAIKNRKSAIASIVTSIIIILFIVASIISFLLIVNEQNFVLTAMGGITLIFHLGVIANYSFVIYLIYVTYLVNGKFNDNVIENETKKTSEVHYDSIIKLKELYDKGIITKEEFDNKKKKHIDKF